MSAPGISVEGIHVLNDSGPQRVQVDIPQQFQQIGIPVADDGFIAILKQVADPVVAQVKGNGITSQQAAHKMGKCGGSRLNQKMEMGVQ